MLQARLSKIKLPLKNQKVNFKMDYFKKLSELLKHAYAKYSTFKVACILVDTNNEIFFGVNVENIAYGNTICAERTAIGNWITNRKDENSKIKTIYILATNNELFTYPCGNCLQSLNEFKTEQTKIVLYNQFGEKIEHKLTDLLPFGIKSLNVK